MKKNKTLRIISIFVIFFYLSAQILPSVSFAFDQPWENGTQAGGSDGGNGPSDDDGGDKPKKGCGEGDPVYMHSGEFYYNCIDLAIPGRGMDVVISHHYRSARNNNAQYGYGWTINYNQRLKVLDTGNVVILDGTARKVEFTYNSTNNSYSPPNGYAETLTSNTNGTWSLTERNKTINTFDVNGLLVSIKDRNNNEIQFQYSSTPQPILGKSRFNQNQAFTTNVIGYDYRLTRIIDTVGRQINFFYNSKGRLDHIIDFAGRRVDYTYGTNSDDLLTVQKTPVSGFPQGITKTFTYNTKHRLISITDERGITFVQNIYNATTGKVVQQTLGDGTAGTGTYLFNYGTNQTTVTDRKGNIRTYHFNAQGDVTQKLEFTSGLRPTDPANFLTLTTYNAHSQLTNITYPSGNGISYAYNSGSSNPRSRDNLLEVRRKSNMLAPDNNTTDLVTTYTYEGSFNFIKTMTDPKGNVTTFTYDYELPQSDPRFAVHGNLVRIDFPSVNGQTSQVNFSYNAYGQMVQRIDPNLNVTQWTYFPTTGYLQSIIQDPGNINAVTQWTYDIYGNVATITDANNHVTTMMHNEQNWLTEMTNPLGFTTKYEYEANGNLKKIQRQMNPVGPPTQWQTVEYTYDSLNNLTSVKDPLNRVTTYTYDNNENLASVQDANLNTTTYQYDERDLLWKVTEPFQPPAVTEYFYTINGQVSKIKDANANQTQYAYDGFNRLDIMTYADATYHDYDYDKDSNIIQDRLPSGDLINYGYDALNRLTTKAYPQNPTLNATYQYDVGSRLTLAYNSVSMSGFNYDALNRLLSETQVRNPQSPQTYTVGYTYDVVGNLRTLSYPMGATLTYQYDDNNRLQYIQAGAFNVTTYTYDPLDRVTQRDMASAVPQRANYQYNVANELEHLTNSLVNIASLQRDYTYDNVGNRDLYTLTYPSVLGIPPIVTDYNYNNRYELTSVTGAQNHTYTYDKLGNRLNADGVSYTPNNLNQYNQVAGQNLTYTTNGNLATKGSNVYSYDQENRLTAVQNPQHNAQYQYDAFNRRIAKIVDGVTTYYIFEGSRIIEERDGAGNFAASFLFGRGLDEILLMVRNGLYIYHHDALGNVTEIFDWNGNPVELNSYDVYGQPAVTQSSIGNPFMFTGQQWDPESGLYYYRARMYDPMLGRFLQRDPIGYYDSMNLFKYVHNNPQNFVDPFGLLPGDSYPTMDDAGNHAVHDYNPTSIAQDREYGGWVTKNPDGTYSYTPSRTDGRKHHPRMPAKPSNECGWYHTHGDDNWFIDDFDFSEGDKSFSRDFGPGYLGTPDGGVKKYDPATGNTTPMVTP